MPPIAQRVIQLALQHGEYELAGRVHRAEADGRAWNAGDSDNAIESRSGTVLTAPFAFKEIYGPYGNNWRVPANDSG
jgi:hypothetical protein